MHYINIPGCLPFFVPHSYFQEFQHKNHLGSGGLVYANVFVFKSVLWPLQLDYTMPQLYLDMKISLGDVQLPVAAWK